MIEMQTIGENIRNKRKEQGMTQAQLAKHLNVSKQMISMYEAARYKLNVNDLCLIAFALNVHICVLLGYPDVKVYEDIEKENKHLTSENRVLRESLVTLTEMSKQG